LIRSPDATGHRNDDHALGSERARIRAPGHLATAAPAPDEIEALIKKGNDLRRSHDDQSALPLLQRAYELQPAPRTAVQLGLVEQALGRWAEADEHLTTGLKARNDPWIQRNRAAIDESVRKVKPHVARVEITGEPAGAEALVNGRLVGKVPLQAPIRVAEGSVDVELRAPGYRRAFRTLTVRGGQYQPVVLRLEREVSTTPAPVVAQPLPAPVPPPAVTALPTPSPPDVNGAAVAMPVADPAPPPDSAPLRWRPWAIGATAAAAVVAGGAGLYGLLRHDSKVHAVNERMCLETQNGVVRRPSSPDEQCVTLNTAYRDARTLSIVGFTAAAALAATAASSTSPPRTRAPRQPRRRRPPHVRPGRHHVRRRLLGAVLG
jgi:hypothetical protein